MKCPKCKSELIKGVDREFETLSDHVCDPNRQSYPLRPTWECKNPECQSQEYGVFWDEQGECYSRKYIGDGFWIDNNSGPFGSLNRRLNVECSYKGVKRNIYLSPAWCLWIYRPLIDFNYEANEDGEVISRRWSLKFLKKDGSDYYSTYVRFIVPSIYRNIRNFLKEKKEFKKQPTKYRREKLREYYSVGIFSSNTYIISQKIITFLFKGFLKELNYIDKDKVKSIIFSNFTGQIIEPSKLFEYLPSQDEINIVSSLVQLHIEGVLDRISLNKYEINKVYLRKQKLRKMN